MIKLNFDMEADGLLKTITKLHCIVTQDMDTGKVLKYHDHPHLCDADGDLLAGIASLEAADELVGHNIKGYDVPAIKKVTGIEITTPLTDTLLISKTQYPDRNMLKGCSSGPHSIEAWGIRLGISKPKHDEWEFFTPAMLHRCSEDVKIQVAVYDHLVYEEGAGWDWSRALRIEHRFATICHDAEMHGWPFDKAAAEGHIEYLAGEMQRIDDQIRPALPLIIKKKETRKKNWGYTTEEGFIECEFNWVSKPFLKGSGKPSKQIQDWYPDNPDVVWGQFSRIVYHDMNLASAGQVKPYLLSVGWKPLEWNINKKTGQVTSPKLTEESLEDLKNPVGKRIAQWLKCSDRKSTIEGWIKHLDDRGRVPSVVNTIGAATHRVTHRVIANVPSIDNKSYFAPEMRALFITDPGYVMVGCDAASCQLRMLCHYMGDDDYTHAVVEGKSKDGTDIHSVNMRLTGVPTRTDAKRFIYGFLFGAGPAKAGRIIGKGKGAGKAMMDSFLEGLPALKNLRDDLKKVWEDRGYLIGLDGRKIFVRKQHMLLCYLLQCAEAIMMKLATCILVDWIEAEGLDANLVCFYHDEYSFHVKTEHAERVAFLAGEAIAKAGDMLGLKVPSAGDPKIGDSWATIH